MEIIFWVIIAYLFLVYVASRFLVPFMGFAPLKKPRVVPEEIKAAVIELEQRSHDQLSYMQNVYDLVLDKTMYQYKHTRFKAGFSFHRLFVKDLSEIWQTKDFLYCTAINYLSFVILTSSKYFKPGDVRTKVVFVNFFIHQYLQVRVNDKWVDFDPAGTGIRGKGLGMHLSIFG